MSETREAFILSKKHQFEELYGPIVTPEQVARYGDFVSRITGRTSVMIEAIAHNVIHGHRVAILAHSMSYCNEIVQKLCEHMHGRYLPETLIDLQTPAEVRRHLILLSKQDQNWEDKLRGHRGVPIFVDNGVTDMVAINYVKYINNLHNPPIRSKAKSLEQEYHDVFGIAFKKVKGVAPLWKEDDA